MIERTYMVIHTLGDGQHLLVARCCTPEEARGLVTSLHELSPGDYTIECSSNGPAITVERNFAYAYPRRV
jgi:hypothetical protein